MPANADQSKPFEIGLVMAGAISAGAYTAGVVDFLLLALEEWHRAKAAKQGERNFPHHRVRLKVLAGSSAGGMTAALTAARLARSGATPDNLLSDAWINQIDIWNLLTTDDLDGGEARSILNGDVIPEIGRAALSDAGRPAGIPEADLWRDYLVDPLHLVLTVSNLRGVPYGLGYGGEDRVSRYEMLTHGDWFHFTLTRGPVPERPANGPNGPDYDSFPPSALPPGPDWLRAGRFEPDDNWTLLREVAVATGAFPVAFPAQRLSRGGIDGYTALVRRLVLDAPEQSEQKARLARRPVSPIFPRDFPSPYPFDAVDGGMVNNEPVDLARRVLGLDLYNPDTRKGEAAVLLVDPFPNTGVFDENWRDDAPDLMQTAGLVLGALKNQARFQPEELAQARDPDVYTQFMISPKRKGRDEAVRPGDWLDIACGSLGGFGGFLHQAYRVHDYQLGRRNCQRFLQERFTLSGKDWLPSTATSTEEMELRAPMFAEWMPPEGDRMWADMHDAAGAVIGEKVALPIIPLFGAAAIEQAMTVPWPGEAFTPTDVRKLRAAIIKRARAVGVGLGIPEMVDLLVGRALGGWVADKLLKRIVTDLRKGGLYPMVED